MEILVRAIVPIAVTTATFIITIITVIISANSTHRTENSTTALLGTAAAVSLISIIGIVSTRISGRRSGLLGRGSLINSDGTASSSRIKQVNITGMLRVKSGLNAS